MGARTKLTERRIERLEFESEGPSRQIHFDATVLGLGVRLYPSGGKSYVLHYGDRRARKLLTLGKVGVLTLAHAREKAAALLVGIAEGEDPLATRRGERRARDDAATVEALGTEFLAHHEGRWSESHYRESKRRIEKHVTPVLGRMKAADVSRPDINRLHAGITSGGAPVEANRVRTILHTMFEWGAEFGHLPEGHPNPAHRRRGSRIGRNREGGRERYLTREEAPKLLAAADSTGDPTDGVLVRLWLLTGLRRSELLHRRWSDIDLEERTLTVPKTKNGRTHTVPLSGRAVELLTSLPRSIAPDAPLFPGKDPLAPRLDYKRPWERIRELSGLHDLTVHDLRRTVATWLAHLGRVPMATVSAVLNHSPPGAGVTALYARPVAESVREALEEMERLVTGVEPSEAVREAIHG